MTTTNPLRLGWIGLGSMGLAMATNLQKHLVEQTLPPLRYWNRTISRGEPLEKIGGIRCQAVEEVVESSDVVFISVSDDEALQTLMNKISIGTSLPGKIFLDTTTIHPNTSAAIATQLSKASASYVAAPVFGSTPMAQSGQLLIAVAGPSDAITTITPFLQGVVARAIIDVGSAPENALLLKTTGNLITAGLMYLLSEAHTLASLAGLPADTLHMLVEHNFGHYVAGVSERLVSGAYCPPGGEAPRSGLELGIKDVGHGVDLARERGMQLRLGDMYLDAAGEAKKWGDVRGKRMDSSSVFGVVRVRAGEEFETDTVKERDAKTKDGTVE